MFVVERFGEDASVVTQMMGIVPSSVCFCGWSSGPKSSWSALEPHDGRKDLAEQIEDLLSLLEPLAPAVKRVAAEFSAWIYISVDDRDFIWPYAPDDGIRSGNFEISSRSVQRAAELSLGIQVRFEAGKRVGPEIVK